MCLLSLSLNGFGWLCAGPGVVDADYNPVEPKPPAPRAVCSPSSSSVSTM